MRARTARTSRACRLPPDYNTFVDCERGGGRARIAVLARIAVIRDNGRDPVRGSAAHSVDQNQKLHQIIIDRRTGRLHDKNILSADIFSDMHADFAFAKTPDKNLGLFNPQLLTNLLLSTKDWHSPLKPIIYSYSALIKFS